MEERSGLDALSCVLAATPEGEVRDARGEGRGVKRVPLNDGEIILSGGILILVSDND